MSDAVEPAHGFSDQILQLVGGMVAEKLEGLVRPVAAAPIPASLAQKIARIMTDLQRLPKNGYNDFHKCHYVMEADVTDALRDLMAQHGVVVLSTIESVAQKVESSGDGRSRRQRLRAGWSSPSLTRRRASFTCTVPFLSLKLLEHGIEILKGPRYLT